MKKFKILSITILSTLLLGACANSNDNHDSSNTSAHNQSEKVSKSRTRKSKHKVHKSKASEQSEKSESSSNDSQKDILDKLVKLTDSKSSGSNKNYYWENGEAKTNGFKDLKAGDYNFSSDSQGRSSVAKAVLTYSEYQSSKGGRQGTPLDPPSWPMNNPIIGIHFELTDRTYHGYLYNRSHSIADSLLGKGSYTSQFNFTTGTRPQNVGADQKGGMRAAEETVEKYWESHPDSKETVEYETTPIYKGDEPVPRGSIVDIKSSDNEINTEIVVINSVEGIKINYNNADSDAQPYVKNTRVKSKPVVKVLSHPKQTVQTVTKPVIQSTNYTKSADWSVAAPGKVFVSDSNKYYSRVKNPDNFAYISQSTAQAEGDQPAIRGNEYAQP
ncbi:DNA/RNA non-specific endonuclease [Pediococcus argentinicus]|uniref:DNA/RNA non-specific endonuclease n=1 Tax=Pediococcus argentinicus TaxID=480391 RepID=UPI00338F8694